MMLCVNLQERGSDIMHTISFPVPVWVRALICLFGCVPIPLLIVAGYLGLELTPYLVIAVGFYATRITSLAFRSDVNNS